MVMYCLSNSKTMEARSEEEFKICRAEMSPGQKYYVKFSSPKETRFYAKGRYSSPGILSKSVPRRKSAGTRIGINRSLNFDLGQRKNQTYSNSPKSNYPLPTNCHLSRSAKILKSLDIDIHAIKSDCKKINKTLNFDSTTPSPKRFSNSHQSMSNLSLDSPGIIKTLHFDSPSSSTDMSPLNMSVESTDENQNQTPSQRNRTAKKSLSYCSSSSRSSDFEVLSPGLRSELRDKIADIVSMTPKFSNSKSDKNHRKIVDSMVASTPRNLIDDYSDDEDEKKLGERKKEKEEEEEERPETPKNTVIVIPESMSAIKKSHRKERVSGRLIKLGMNMEKSLQMDIEAGENDEMRSKTPEALDEQPSTPNCSIASIKKSHKKDKSKRKSFNYHSDDELSETGSLFDYSEIEKLEEDTGMSIGEKEEGNKINLSNLMIPKIVVDPASPLPGSHESQPPKSQEAMINNNDNPSEETDNSSTPENKIDYIRRVMTSSIKKSHKKLKDSNKKSLFKPRILDEGLDEDDKATPPKNNEKIDNESRSGTPVNMNSSRLLLDRFSSVKKSHRKDKHRAVGFSQRQINLSNEKNKEESLTMKSSSEVVPKICVTGASSASEKNWQFENLGTSPLDENEPRSSPNKRKSPSSKKFQGSTRDWRIETESADEEFQIFTPIKKKRPLKTATTSEETGKLDDKYLEKSMDIGRCETPRLCGNADDDSFKTPIKVTRSSLPRVNTGDLIDDANGRLTPENQAPPRIIALSSIKKSHKKIKWTKSCKKTSYIMKKLADSNNKELEESSMDCQTTHCDNLNPSVSEKINATSDQSPRASTSIGGKSENNSPAKTPPNCLETKTYMRLMQTTSIKRSHKKMRDKKKQESIILEPNLSDDGSLFDEAEKSAHLADLEQSDCLPLADDDEEEIVNSFSAEKDVNSKRHCRSGNRSDDGSIFGSDDELPKSPRKRITKTVKIKSRN